MDGNERTERGQVGIGTLIVFIAMVLVAAIAAGVLIDTAGFLQSQSEETGEQSSQQVTDRVTVVSETGIVSSGKIADLELDLSLAPGSGDVDLDEGTIHWVGPDGADEITSGSWTLTAISGTTPVLSDESDLIQLKLDLGSLNGNADELDPGESATLRFVTADGGQTTVTLVAPETLSGEAAVEL